MASAAEILAEVRIEYQNRPRYYAVCPFCSHLRKQSNRKKKVMGVTIDSVGVQWGCNHCGEHGGKFFDGKSRPGHAGGIGRKAQPTTSYADHQRKVRSGWR